MALPPTHLKAPSPLLRRALMPIWAVLMVFALVAQVGGTAKTVANYLYYNPPFDALGLISEEYAFVRAAPGVAQVADLPSGTMIYAIDGKAVDPYIGYEELSRRLAGPMGSRVVLSLATDKEQGEIELERSAAIARQVTPVWSAVIDRIILPALALVAAGFGLYVSWLMWRRRDDPVAQVLAFGLIGLVLTSIQTDRFLQWATASLAVQSTGYNFGYLLGLTCLIVAIPAYPDSRFRPRWSGWTAVLAPLVGLFGFVVGAFLGAQTTPQPVLIAVVGGTWNVFSLLVLGAVVAAFLRFRATPPGIERQKIKWAALGIIFGLSAILFAERVLPYVVLPEPTATMLVFAGDLLRAIGVLAIPLGLFMSFKGLRLNDADGAIGRSAGYAVVTLLIGAVWAASTTWVNKLIGEQVSPAAATGISTMIAAAVFVPTRERILKWTEARFQPALVRMRGLPAKLLPWRVDHNPAEVARGALLAVVNGMQACTAALVLTEAQGNRVLATYETNEEAGLADVLMGDDGTRTFPLHVRLSDLIGTVGYLLVGPRSDGASYNSDEKKAIQQVAGPLAEVLRATSRRADRNRALGEMLTAVDARVARLEAMRQVA